MNAKTVTALRANASLASISQPSAPTASVAPKIIASGKSKAASIRNAAFVRIAALSFSEQMTRDQLVEAIRNALGDKPTESDIALVRIENIVGRVAARLPASALPANMVDALEIMAFARKLVCDFDGPATDGKRTKALRAGKIGRRTETQHNVVRNAEKAWSQLAGDVGIGAAQGQAAKNDKAKRAPHHNQPANPAKPNASPINAAQQAPAKGAALPDHGTLIQPSKPTTADDATGYLSAQAASLASYANKYAKVLPTDFGAAVLAFKSAIAKAEAAYQERKALADAVDADKSERQQRAGRKSKASNV